MSTPVGSLQASQDVISPGGRDRHRTGQKEGVAGANKNAAWSESKPSGIDGLGPRLTNENRHPSVQVVRGSTNIDLSRGEIDGETADRSNAPIAVNNDVEVVDETKCCCFFKRKIKKKRSGRSKCLALLQRLRQITGDRNAISISNGNHRRANII